MTPQRVAEPVDEPQAGAHRHLHLRSPDLAARPGLRPVAARQLGHHLPATRPRIRPPRERRQRVTFYHPTDGYLYGWRWSDGDEAWWSTEDLALRYTHDIAGQPGEPIRRRYIVGEVKAWDARPRCGDVVTDPSGDERVCTLISGHLGPWHDDGTGCWSVEP